MVDVELENFKKMATLGADVCLAFLYEEAGNVGTKNCIKCAKEAHINVLEFTIPKEDD